MSSDLLDRAAGEVLARYDPPALTRETLGNAGGFSGARLWHVSAADGDWCLKAWPSTSAERLVQIHAWMSAARHAGLDFVPRVRKARDGSTAQEAAGRVWDLCEWMPGEPRSPEKVKSADVAAACAALAQLHVVWSRGERRRGPCEAVARRLKRIADWSAATNSGWQPNFIDDDPVTPLARRAWELVPPCIDLARKLLEPLRDVPFRLHPCLGDVWCDHVLLIEARVTGIIDFGAARIDTPAVDLARLLGSFTTTSDELFNVGVQTYRPMAMLNDDEFSLMHVLDYTGTLIGAANWLLWLYRDRRDFPDRAAVVRRLGALVARLERTHRFTLPLVQ